jgi:hypothetical protein
MLVLILQYGRRQQATAVAAVAAVAKGDWFAAPGVLPWLPDQSVERLTGS